MRQGTCLLVQRGPQHETRNVPIGTERATVLVLDKERAYWYKTGPQHEIRNVPIGTGRATV